MNAAGILIVTLLLTAMTSVAVMAEKGEARFETEEGIEPATPSNAEKTDVDFSNAELASPSNAGKKEENSGYADPATSSNAKKDKSAVTPGNLAGTWTIDGTTSYRFDHAGRGALILPEHSYLFSYRIESDTLVLQFDKAGIGTAVFTAEIREDMLMLTRIEQAGTAEFLLERVKTTDHQNGKEEK